MKMNVEKIIKIIFIKLKNKMQLKQQYISLNQFARKNPIKNAIKYFFL